MKNRYFNPFAWVTLFLLTFVAGCKEDELDFAPTTLIFNSLSDEVFMPEENPEEFYTFITEVEMVNTKSSVSTTLEYEVTGLPMENVTVTPLEVSLSPTMTIQQVEIKVASKGTNPGMVGSVKLTIPNGDGYLVGSTSETNLGVYNLSLNRNGAPPTDPQTWLGTYMAEDNNEPYYVNIEADNGKYYIRNMWNAREGGDGDHPVEIVFESSIKAVIPGDQIVSDWKNHKTNGDQMVTLNEGEKVLEFVLRLIADDGSEFSDIPTKYTKIPDVDPTIWLGTYDVEDNNNPYQAEILEKEGKYWIKNFWNGFADGGHFVEIKFNNPGEAIISGGQVISEWEGEYVLAEDVIVSLDEDEMQMKFTFGVNHPTDGPYEGIDATYTKDLSNSEIVHVDLSSNPLVSDADNAWYGASETGHQFGLFFNTSTDMGETHRLSLENWGGRVIGRMVEDAVDPEVVPLLSFIDAGVEIGANSDWLENPHHDPDGTWWSIPFVASPKYSENFGKTGYVAMELSSDDGSEIYYTWIRVEVAQDGASMKLLEYAYNKVGNPIKVGQKVS
ncbi:hypothetical protein [Aureibacter tunicatorum]|uniref:Uncharacterized protein n=1 Tax=Aureibacter tunicatorum TaxID=866807 RepID=A0AAE4BVE0_9BACT|nr:hypothetical protein [Aureibacter tunicatorum]MDR6241990.1 hypothetical protein [Aureibacter tunicatorum]BDD07277.1 hypothetical protein AUTU_47600 [Aureibacter tunicatorum]